MRVLILHLKAQMFQNAVFSLSGLFNHQKSPKGACWELFRANFINKMFLGGLGSAELLTVAVRTSN